MHLSESCEDDAVHLLTHAMTTIATVHEARCTAVIHQALLQAEEDGLIDYEFVDDIGYSGDMETILREIADENAQRDADQR